MTREPVDVKARRYLGEGRLVVERAGVVVAARCRGGSTVYDLGFSADTGWWCSCPARGRCAHLVALQLVTPPPGGASESVPGEGAVNEGGGARCPT